MTILVCGEALYDLFQVDEPEPGRLSLDARVGGSPFNVAIGIARLGGKASLLTGISTDLLGSRLMARLEAEGVGVDLIIRSGRRTTLSLVGLDPNGSPEYAFYGVGSADCAISASDLPAVPDHVEALHFGSYSIAVRPVADAFAELAARESHRFLSLDPNVRLTIEPEIGLWRERIASFAASANLIKVSAEDLGLLWPGRAAAEIAHEWLGLGADCVIVTDGGAAVRAWRADGEISVATEAVEIVDTVGAGDSFQAAVLSALQARGAMAVGPADLSSEDLAEILAFAARAAAMTCARRGADLPGSVDLRLPS
ncbi:MAG: carbohydrate kinase [Pseudomonadota bacterium]